MTRLDKLSYLVAIAIVSASSLAYEMLLMRLFSIIQWHHFAYMIISLALLGYGISGTFLALNRDRLIRYFPTVILANLLLFSISIPVCFLLVQQLPLNPLEIVWSPVQLWYLLATYLVLSLPFFFAANVIGLSFYRYKEQVSSLYAADLVGAGFGSIAIIMLLFVVFPEKILILLQLSLLLAALILSVLGFREQQVKTGRWNVVIISVAVIALIIMPRLDTVSLSPYKSLKQFLTIPNTHVLEQQSSPLGLITIAESPVIPLRHAPGLSLKAVDEPPQQLAVFTDGDGMTAITQFDGDRDAISYLDQTTSALPYHFKPLQDVLILGAGTGTDVLQAIYHGSAHIDAVEQNVQIIDLLKHNYADFSGHIYTRPEVQVHLAEARGFVTSSSKSYDLISIPLMDAFGASASGLYSMTENYLYTEQAIQAYLQHLNKDGYLSLTRWVKLPARDMPKLLATVISALKQENIQAVQQILLIRSWQTNTLIVKNGLITDEEIKRLKQFCSDRDFDLVFYPGIKEQETNQFNILQQPYFYQATQALLSDQSKAFIDAYKFNIEPATDDKPYVFQFFKWQTLPEILPLLASGGISLLDNGYLILIAALIQALVASLLLIALPLWLWKDKLGIKSAEQESQHALIYFFSLGLAFLFIEIAFIQKFILILHHPIYAITTVISTFLLSAGLGSYVSSRIISNVKKYPILVPISGIALFASIYMLNIDAITIFLQHQPDQSRFILSILLIMPLGFFMGMPFPMGLARLSLTRPQLIPWAWGVNGFASVISAILATLIAMQFGFMMLVVFAVVLYGMAAYFFPK